jgi:hypothetical protein
MLILLCITHSSCKALNTTLNRYLWKGREKEGRERRKKAEWRDR